MSGLAGPPTRAAHLLLIPDLVNSLLTGRTVTEYTNATTTQLVSADTGTWDDDLIAALGLPRKLFCPVIPTGATIGPLLSAIAGPSGLDGIVVVAPATHDTGSAIAGTPSTSATTCSLLLSSGFLLLGSESNATAAIVVFGAFGMTLQADATTSRSASRVAMRALAMPAQRATAVTVSSPQGCLSVA